MTTMARTHAYAMTWSRVTAAPSTVYTSTGCGARPGAWKISLAAVEHGGERRGPTTETPMVTTTLMSCDDSRRKRKIAM